MENFNKNQKIVIYAYAILALIFVFLHNPTQGYITFDIKIYPWVEAEIGTNCKKEGVSFLCEYDRPIMQWFSSGAIFDWLGLVVNFAWALIMLSAIALIAFFAASNKNTKNI